MPDNKKKELALSSNWDNIPLQGDNQKASGALSTAFGDKDFGESQYDEDILPSEFIKDDSYQKLRGVKQGFGAEATNALIGGLAKVPFSMIGNTASMLDFEDYYNQDKEIGNAITAWTEEVKGDIEGATKIYQSNEDHLTSREWWMNNAKGLIDSGIGFAATGYGLGKGVQLLSTALKSSKVVPVIGTITNAVAMNQMESVPIAMNVYKKAKELGKSDEDAADAAAHSININRLNIPLNITSVGAFIRPMSATRQIAKDFSKREILKKVALEGTQEYLEEDINMIAENEGLRKAKEGNDYTYDFNNTVNEILSKEGFEQGLVGFLGGAFQTGATDVISALAKDAPSYDSEGNVKLDEQGQPLKVSRIQSQREQYKAQQNSLNKIELLTKSEGVNTLKETLDKVKFTSEKLNDIQIASLANDELKVNELKNDLLTNQAYDAFKNGTTEQLINTYKSIQRDPSSKEKFGENYNIKATEAIQDIEKLEKVYQTYQHLPQVENVFNNRSDYFYNLKTAKELHGNLAKAQAEQFSEIQATGYTTPEKINTLETTKELIKIEDKLNKIQSNLHSLNDEFENIVSDKHTEKVKEEKANQPTKEEVEKIEDDNAEKEALKYQVDLFVDKTIKGEKLDSPEAIEFYQNNKDVIEQELLAKQNTEPQENTTSEESSIINNETIIDDNSEEGRKASTIFKSTTGPDNQSLETRNTFYRTVEKLKLDGHKLLIVTKATNPELYKEILANDEEATRYEKASPDYKGIWTVLVDKNGEIVRENGKLIQSTLETAQRIADNKVDVARGIKDPKAIALAKTEAMRAINDLRGQIIGSPDGKYTALKEPKYLPIIGKSKGLMIETDENANVIHSAFEPKDANGNRVSNNINGRIFPETTELKSVKLQLATFNEVFEKVKVLPGKLYTIDDNGRVFDLIPRLVNDSEIIDLIIPLINKILLKDESFSPKDEIKKIISFQKSKNPKGYDIYTTTDKEGIVWLFYNGNSTSLKTFEQDKPALIEFLKTKRVNANNKYLLGESFSKPDLNGLGTPSDYKEYLLSSEQPMFGTDLKKDSERRFIQSYLIYEPKLVDGKKLKDATTLNASDIIEDNNAEIIEETPITKKDFKKRSLNREFVEGTKLSQKEKDDFRKLFPNVPFETVFGLIEGKALGQFIDSGKVLLSDQATEGTLQHESFHIVTQLYLTKEEIDKLYSEASNLHPNKSRLELEEILAEDFVNYKKNGAILKGQPVRNTIFRRLLNFIKDLLNLSATDVQQVYERLDKGYYTNKKIVGSREFSSLNRDEKTIKLTKDKGTKFVKDLFDGMDTIFYSHLFKGGATPIATSSNVNSILDKMFDDFVDTYKVSNNKQLVENYEYILENWDDIIQVWSKRLNINGVELKINEKAEDVKEEIEPVNKEEEKTERAGDAYQEGNLTSVLETLPSNVRILIRSLSQVGITNDLGFSVPVDFASTYNYILKNLSGVGSSYEDVYNKLESLVPNKPELRELLDRLGEPQYENISEEQFNFQTEFTVAFNKNRTTSYITIYKPNGDIYVVDANRQNEADKAKTIWEANLTTKTKLSEDGKLMIPLEVINETDSIKFLSSIGITFDKATLAEINSPGFDNSKLNDSTEAIRQYITKTKGDLTNLYKYTEEKEGVSGRVNYLLELEAKYTTLVNELSYISTENKTEYSVSENNGLSNTKNIINNSTSKTDLFNKLPHLNTITVEGSYWMNELFLPLTGERNKGINIELNLHNGSRSSTEYTGTDLEVPTRKGTKGDLFTQQMTSILEGQVDYIVSADKSQEYTIGLNYYNGNKKLPISIESFKTNFNNNKLKQIFRNYFKAELKRIAKFELDGVGRDIDIYGVDSKGRVGNGNKFTVFQDILKDTGKGSAKDLINNKLEELKGNSYSEIEEELNAFTETILPEVDKLVLEFFNFYFNEFNNSLEDNGIKGNAGFSADLLKEYSKDQLIRTVLVTDLINSIEQSKLFIGDLAFYKDLYKRTAMFTGSKTTPRIDENMNLHLINKHPRKDGKKADGKEKTIVFADINVTKDVKEYIPNYLAAGFTEEEAYNILGFTKKEDLTYEGNSAYGAADEADAMGWGSLDFIKEFHKRISTWTPLMDEAYNIIQKQKFDEFGNLIEGELLNKDQIALFQTLKLQYAGPKEYNELYVPSGYKFTVMPLIPQMIAGKNLSKLLDKMTENQSGISMVKSGSKFGTIVDAKTGKASKFYENGNSGEISKETPIIQTISYQYLGLQVKPSPPKSKYIMSTQFRKTMLINAFENGKPVKGFPEAKELLNTFNGLIAEKTNKELKKLVDSLGLDPDNYTANDVSNLVDLLVKEAEERKLTDNIINSIDVEIENGKKLLKYNIDSMVNKPKIDSMLMSLVNSRLIRQKVNGDAYVLAPVTGMENIGERNIGSNNTLRGYTQDEKTKKTIPAEVMVPLSKNFYPLLKKFGSLKAVNNAIKEGKIDPKVLELVACRIPGQGMNSNEYLTIKEFLPEDSATTMIAHPDIVAKAGSDFDNDKLYTYRPSLDENGNYIEESIENKLIDVIKQFISNEYNFLALITPNSTSLISPIVDDIKYDKYVNEKTEKNLKLVEKGDKPKKVLSKEEYIKVLKDNKQGIKYTDLLKLHKKINARHKLWSAKDEVGPSAIANAYGPLAQIADLKINNTYKDVNSGEEKSVIINLPHNKSDDGKLNMASIKDALGINNISEINNQLINIIVDAAKDEEPMVAHLNMTIDTLPIYLYLNRLGVPFEYSAALMTQPIITEWINKTSNNKSIFLKVTNKTEKRIGSIIEDKLYKILEDEYFDKNEDQTFDLYLNKRGLSPDSWFKSSIGLNKGQLFKALMGMLNTKYTDEVLLEAFKEVSARIEKYRLQYPKKIFTEVELKNNRLSVNQKSEQYIIDQIQVLNDFLAYKEQAQLFGEAVRITNVDSNGVGQNINAEKFKLEDYEKVKKTNLVDGIDRIIDKTFIKSFQQGEFTIKAYSQFYDIHKDDKIAGGLKGFFKDLNKSNPFLSEDDKLKLMSLIENDFINFVIQNYGYKDISASINSLFKGENSVAKELLKLKTKEVLTEDESKLLNNILIKELFPLIDKAKRGTDFDNVKIYSRKLDTFTSNQLTEAFRELKDSKLALGTRLMHLGILQSGLANSHITYLGLIPFEHYNGLVKDSFNKFNKSEIKLIDLVKFRELFVRNNTSESSVKRYIGDDLEAFPQLGMGLYGKNYDLKNSNTKVEEVKTSEIIENITTNPKDFTNYSGAASGGDAVWSNIGKEFGIGKQVDYRPEDLSKLNGEQKLEVENAYQKAVKDLGRNPLAGNTYAGGLVRRDYLQAKAANSVFAISAIVEPQGKDKKGYVNKTNKQIVEGGTGYAVQMAINLGKPTFVFDQNKNQWFTWKDNKFIETSTPTLTTKFAGIGTREINDSGRKAIRDVYEKTFNKANKIEDKKDQPILIKEDDLSNFKKGVKLNTKEVSSLQKAMILKRVKPYNEKNNTNYSIDFTKVGQSDNHTWIITESTKPKVVEDKIVQPTLFDNVAEEVFDFIEEQYNDIKSDIEFMFENNEELKKELISDLNNIKTKEDLGNLLIKICK